MLHLKICLTQQNYYYLRVQRNRTDNKVNWRLGKTSQLYICNSSVATGMSFLALYIACALPVTQCGFQTPLHPEGEASEDTSALFLEH